MRRSGVLTGLVLVSLASPAFAVGSAVTLDLGQGDIERRTVTYECEGREPLTVTYVNAAPNFIALLAPAEDALLFVAVQSESGARYVSGHWAWEASGPEGRLFDLAEGTGNSPVAECLEITETP